MRLSESLNPLFGGSAFRTPRRRPSRGQRGLNPLFGGSAFRTLEAVVKFDDDGVLIPFLAGLLFGPSSSPQMAAVGSLNPLFGGSAFRTYLLWVYYVKEVLIPFLAGLLFGPPMPEGFAPYRGLNPLFGGSAFRTVNTQHLGD